MRPRAGRDRHHVAEEHGHELLPLRGNLPSENPHGPPRSMPPTRQGPHGHSLHRPCDVLCSRHYRSIISTTPRPPIGDPTAVRVTVLRASRQYFRRYPRTRARNDLLQGEQVSERLQSLTGRQALLLATGSLRPAQASNRSQTLLRLRLRTLTRSGRALLAFSPRRRASTTCFGNTCQHEECARSGWQQIQINVVGLPWWSWLKRSQTHVLVGVQLQTDPYGEKYPPR